MVCFLLLIQRWLFFPNLGKGGPRVLLLQWAKHSYNNYHSRKHSLDMPAGPSELGSFLFQDMSNWQTSLAITSLPLVNMVHKYTTLVWVQEILLISQYETESIFFKNSSLWKFHYLKKNKVSWKPIVLTVVFFNIKNNLNTLWLQGWRARVQLHSVQCKNLTNNVYFNPSCPVYFLPLLFQNHDQRQREFILKF